MGSCNNLRGAGSRPQLRVDTDEGRSQIACMTMDGAKDVDSPAPNHLQVATSNPQPTTNTQPSVTGTWIKPYGLPADAASPDPNASIYRRQALDNSGVSILNNYPVSTSPRMPTEEVHRNLNTTCGSMLPDDGFHDIHTDMESGDPLGKAKVDPIDLRANFQPFSWDSTHQPRTKWARAEGYDDDKSPRTK